MTADATVEALIHSVDLDGLIRHIDTRADDGDWAGIDRIRRLSIAATRETGRQLWPAATLAEYRLALSGPPEWAATVLDGEHGRFTIGPLSEVAAVHHRWVDLAPHLAPNPTATFVAHERAIRGEEIDAASILSLPPVLDIPLSVADWEPDYPHSVYRAEGAEHPEPPRTSLGPADVIDLAPARADDDLVDDDTELAFSQLIETWTTGSTGHAESTCVSGSAERAVSRLGVRRGRLRPIAASEALADLAWAGASGGAHGRRRGMASGRFSMWWLLTSITDADDECSADDLGEAARHLQWFRWDALEPAGGWRLQLAVEDRDEGISWAFNARDDA